MSAYSPWPAAFSLALLLVFLAVSIWPHRFEKVCDSLVTAFYIVVLRVLVFVLDCIETYENRQLDRIISHGMRGALQRGWIDLQGNVIKRDKCPHNSEL